MKGFLVKIPQLKVLLLSILIFGLQIQAETIILRNGSTIQGKVLGHDSESVTVSVDGTTKNIPKSNVYKVIFSSNNSEMRKFMNDRKTGIENKSAKFEPDDSSSEFDIDENSGDKKQLTSKLTQLEKKIDKLEKKITRLREKITRLKVKIKEKQNEEKRMKTAGKS